MSTQLQSLADKVCAAIPMARGLQFEYLSWDGQTLTMRAPLAPNINDKGTFFAGSQSILLTLAGWSLTTLLAEDLGVPSDVVAVQSELSYLLPVTGDMQVEASISPESLQAFTEKLPAKGRSRLDVAVIGRDPQGAEAARFNASYLARQYETTA